jgi:mRNA-degrading endonuclease RelE of RelBE toxin-antitoxin system
MTVGNREAMANKPPVSLGYSEQFVEDVKRLEKKYRNIRRDVDRLAAQLRKGELPGNLIQGTGYTVFKVRLKSSDLTKGKSGGYRVIYYLKTATFVVLITMYVKTQKTDIVPSRIKELIEDYQRRSEG